VLKENMTNKLMIFERKIMRKMFGPIRTDDGYWRKTLNWLGHVERMAEDNIVQKIKKWKLVSKRPIGRPKTRWDDDVLEDKKSINIPNWKKVAQNRDSWKKLVEQARTLYRLWRFIRRNAFNC